MPTSDRRTVMTARVKGRRATSGKYHVEYRDGKGTTLAATVLGPGTVSGLKLNIDTSGGNTRIIDNVAAATGLKQTNVYFLREG
jgi:hypothetical protein